jgi:TolB-like protein/DNA-binding winged helix-turn-helix (wHTH) protein
VIYRFERFRVDDVEFRLSADDQSVALEPKALRVLLYLVENRNRLVRKGELLDQVWEDANVAESTLTRSIGLLRKALDDDSRNPRYIETVPTAGYRFICRVDVSDGTGEAMPEGEIPAPGVGAPTASNSKSGRRAAQVALLSGCVVLLVLAAGWMIERRMHAASRIRSLAVLPLDNLSGDPGQEYFADGMTDELITQLARIPNLRVVSRTSAMQEKGAHKPLQQIAQELNVDAIVEGSIVRAGDKVRITAQLIDTRDDRHLWAQSFEGSMSDLLSLQDSVANEVASHAKVTMAPAENSEARNASPAAYDAYLRGRYFLDRRDVLKSAGYFEQAISIDPNYAFAYSGLANALESKSALEVAAPEEVMPQAIAAAEHAIALDPADGEAYSALGAIDSTYLLDWKNAERNLLRGIELSPNDSMAEMHYAVYLDAMDRPEDAVMHMRRALALDPLSFISNRHLGSTLFFARHYDEALYYLRRAEEIEPNHQNVVENWISWAYEKKGMQDEAVSHNLAIARGGPSGEYASSLRAIYRSEGWRGYWEARVNGTQPGPGACAAYGEAIDYLRIGDRDRAFLWMNKAVDRHCLWVIWIQVDPLVDGLRGDPRYSALLERLKLSK